MRFPNVGRPLPMKKDATVTHPAHQERKSTDVDMDFLTAKEALKMDLERFYGSLVATEDHNRCTESSPHSKIPSD